MVSSVITAAAYEILDGDFEVDVVCPEIRRTGFMNKCTLIMP